MRTALAVPDVRLHPWWAAALRDFGPEFPHGSGLEPGVLPDLDEAGCAAVVADLRRYADPTTVPPGRVPCSYFWLVEDGVRHAPVVGFLAVRHRLDAFLLEQGGHIGYSVRPAARRRGHASRALRLGVAHAAALGVDRVLVTCDSGNEGSRLTIERAGGVLEDVRAGRRRYWISAGGAAPGLR